MTSHEDLDRVLASWFEDEASSSIPDGGLDRVRNATGARRPLPAWIAGLGSRWVELPVSGPSSGRRLLLWPAGLHWSTVLILLLILAALLGATLLVGARVLQPPEIPADRLGHLAYGIDGDIYVADWNGTNPLRITDRDSISSPVACRGFGGSGPIWSPDGRHLAFRSYWSDLCPGMAYIADAQGHTVGSFSGGGWLLPWSPDSTRVATWVEGDGAIGIFGLDGVQQAVVTVPPGTMAAGDYDPAWSPDGQSLVVPHGVELPVDGSSVRVLPPSDPRSGRNWTFSPQGTVAAYVDGGSLVVAAPDGSRARVIVGGGVQAGGSFRSPMWSPTGDRLVFVATAAGERSLRIAEVESGRVTSIVTADASTNFGPLAFSPAGDRILYARWEQDDTTGIFSNQALWTIRLDGSDAELLVTGTDWGDWQWLPAGSQ